MHSPHIQRNRHDGVEDDDVREEDEYRNDGRPLLDILTLLTS